METKNDTEQTGRNLSRWRFLRTMIWIGCIGFGGGNALIPVMQKELVDETKAITAEEFDEDVMVASITPGALPVEIASGIGSRLHGVLGMFLGAFGIALPGVGLALIFLSSLSTLSKETSLQISFLMLGVSAYIICLLLDYIVTTLQRLQKTSSLVQAWLVIIIVFLLTCGKSLYRVLGIDFSPMFAIATVHVFTVAFFLIFFLYRRMDILHLVVATVLSMLYIIVIRKDIFLAFPVCFYVIGMIMLVLAVQGIVHSISKKIYWRRRDFSSSKRELLALVTFLMACTMSAFLVYGDTPFYVFNGLLSSIMSFGGGDAYLTVADALFVETTMITEDEFYGVVVPIVNLLPGSILCKTLSSIGYFIGYNASGMVGGAIVVAVAGFAASVVASCGVFSIVRCFFHKFQQLEIFRVVQLIIRPIVSGLLLTVALTLIYQGKKLGMDEGIGWLPVFLLLGLTSVNSWLYFTRNISNLNILCFSITAAMAVCNLWI